MRFNVNALKAFIDTDLTADAIAEQLTELGLEVESVTPAAPPFSGVVVGEIVSAEQHPNADRLRVCDVNIGNETLLHIVCGAKNARAGIKVCVAQIGAILPGDFKITRAKLRGVESEGMLCSETELGLKNEADGIMELAPDAPLGQNVRDYLALDDTIIDLSITPNRGDCFSVLGIARELAARNGLMCRSPADVLHSSAFICHPREGGDPETASDRLDSRLRGNDSSLKVIIDAPEACPCYLALALNHIDNSKPSPLWMQQLLNYAGMRSVSLAVDVLNYVMLLLGQPMHAFDADKINGPVTVRFAKKAEKLMLLNSQQVELDDQVLVIADNENVLALAGVMGGAASEVTAASRRIILESAFFTPGAIMGRARRFGLHTEAAQRFERGVDFNLPKVVLEIAAGLIQQFAGGECTAVVEQVLPDALPHPKRISLAITQVEKLLGIMIPLADIENILKRLGCEVEVFERTSLQITPPSWRFDLNIAEDMIEEIARLYGYQRILPVLPKAVLKIGQHSEKIVALYEVRDYLRAQGFNEAVTYSFIDPKWQQHFSSSDIKLANPLSAELSLMRSSLIPGLLEALSYNVRRQQQEVRLFEIGRTFMRHDNKIVESERLGLLALGKALTLSWREIAPMDFYGLKSIVTELFTLGRHHALRFSTEALPSYLHPGRAAVIFLDNKIAGMMGELHPHLVQELDLDAAPYVAELDMVLLRERQLPLVKMPSKFPGIRRDIAILVAREVRADDILTIAKEAAGKVLVDAAIFDVYEGERLPEGEKSIAFAMILQSDERTLLDEEVQELSDKVIAALKSRFGATLRA